MASWHVNQLKFAFGLTSIMSFYGVVSVAVWLLGDTLGYGMAYRVVIIAMVLLTLPFALVGNYFATRRKKKAEAKEEEAEVSKEEAKSSTKNRTSTAQIESDEDVSKGAEEVIQFLKGSNLGTNGKGAAYSLPWYLVAGGPGSGKSSLVLGSGLNFQTLPSQRQSEQNFVRPTRQVDWRVTSDAVFIDTAGRFQTDNANEEDWSSILETIKKQRSDRPLDGLILAVNTEKILRSDDRQIEQMAKTIRSRLDDTTKRLKTKFPIYLVFTHADAIEGFRDSFSTSKKEGENLVWGTTIPLEKTDNAQALFDSEYEILQDSIMKRRLIRLSAPFSPTRQLRIFNFPLHFASARRKLGTFVNTLFRPNPFSESPFLRGFYFTAVPLNRGKRGRKPGKNLPKTVGKSYFTKKFFRDVVLRDKDLVKTFQEQRQKPPILGWLLTILGTFVTIVLLALVGVSLFNNKSLVDDAAGKGEALLAINKASAGKDPLTKNADETRREIDAMENLRKVLVKLDDYERNGAPWYMRLGLYSGNKVYRESLLRIYYNAVEQRFRQPTERRVLKELQQFASSPTITNTDNLDQKQIDLLEEKYNLLKTYLMWSGGSYDTDSGKVFYKEQAEPTTFSETLKDYWFAESKLPTEYKDTAKAQLDFYFKQVDRENTYPQDKSGFPRIEFNTPLVKNVRNKLKAYPNYLRYLNRVTSAVSKKTDAVKVETILSGRSKGVLEGTHTIPGAYTLEGYRNHMKDAIANANEELSKDDWVMGDKAGGGESLKKELTNLRNEYFKDYADQWRELIRTTKIIKYEDKETMSKALNAFSNEDSPMKALLEEVARNTNLSAEAESQGWMEWIKSFWSKKEKTKTGGNTPVETAFRPLFKYVGSGNEEETKSAPISTYGSKLKPLAGFLNEASEDKIQKITKELAEEKGTFVRGLNNVDQHINTSTEAFQTTSAGQEITVLLKEPVAQVRVFFGAGVEQQIRKGWANQILTKAKEIENGYPFNNDGESDLNKVTDFLNPTSGELSQFYNKNLEKYFEKKDGKLVVKESSNIKFNSEFVTYLNNAFELRRVLFNDKAAPNFEYEYKLLPVKNAIVEVTIDGKKITSQGTSSGNLSFPAPTGSENGVSIVTSATGSSTTSGNPLPPTTPANNPDSSVTNPTSNFLQDTSNAQLKFQGSWGLFRFFDAGSPSKQPGGDYILTHSVGGITIKSVVKPKGGDLFNKTIFTRLKAPNEILQK